MCYASLTILALCVAGADDSHRSVPPKIDLAALRRAIEENEARYRDYEFSMESFTQSYDRFGVAAKEQLRRFRTERAIRQGGLYRYQGSSEDIQEGMHQKSTEVQGFDGISDRRYTGRFGYVFDKAQSPFFCLSHPHMLLFRDWGYRVPLSVLVAGGEAYHNHPNKNLGEGWTLTTEVVGEERLDGLRCIRLHLAIRSEVHSNRMRIWLAVDRNYMPAKIDIIDQHVDEATPINSAKVVEFTEAEPGLWFPKKIEGDGYWEPLPFKKIERLSSTFSLTVKAVSLKPDYPAAFFSAIKFPAGTLVHQVSGDMITSSELIPEAPARQSGGENPVGTDQSQPAQPSPK